VPNRSCRDEILSDYDGMGTEQVHETMSSPINKEETQGPTETCCSKGHPQLCKRVCPYFARGYCKDGQSCKWCHLPHLPVAKFDQVCRSFLENISFERRVHICLPSLRERAVDWGFEHAASMLLQYLEQHSTGTELWTVKMPEHLLLTAQKMTFAQLLAIFVTSANYPHRPEPQILQEVTQLYQVLRQDFCASKSAHCLRCECSPSAGRSCRSCKEYRSQCLKRCTRQQRSSSNDSLSSNQQVYSSAKPNEEATQGKANGDQRVPCPAHNQQTHDDNLQSLLPHLSLQRRIDACLPVLWQRSLEGGFSAEVEMLLSKMECVAEYNQCQRGSHESVQPILQRAMQNMSFSDIVTLFVTDPKLPHAEKGLDEVVACFEKWSKPCTKPSGEYL